MRVVLVLGLCLCIGVHRIGRSPIASVVEGLLRLLAVLHALQLHICRHPICVNVGYSCVPYVLPMLVCPVLCLFLCIDAYRIGRSPTASVVEGLLR